MQPLTKPRIAIIVQRYGADVSGGAERAARDIAEHLTALAEVHVLTTCAEDYTTWANVFPAGPSMINGVHVQRFPVDRPRDWVQSQRETGRLLLGERTLAEEIAWIRHQGPFSTPLLRFIRRHEPDFDLFFFFTYLYATTFFGLPLVAHKAILLPAAHDEPFLYMDAYRALFHLPQQLIYLTAAEKELVQRVTGNGRLPSHIVALGIEAPPGVDGNQFRHKFGVTDPFLFYGGRLSESKNVPELFDFFRRFRAENGRSPLKLVVTGHPHIPIPNHADIIPIGFVADGDKFDALQAATLAVLPSLLESLSIIILEAWLMGTPVLVNGRCQVTRQQVRQSSGGLYYTTYDEFAAVLNRLLSDPTLRTCLGQNGRAFVQQRYTWPTVLETYSTVLSK